MSPKNEENYTPVASLAASRADVGFLELVDGKVVINGFHSIAGKKFIITNVLGKTVFSPYDENSNEIPSATFIDADLSNPTMIDFLRTERFQCPVRTLCVKLVFYPWRPYFFN